MFCLGRSEFDHCCILEGEAKNCRKILKVAALCNRSPSFWKLKNKHKSVELIDSRPAPQGSYICDSFISEKIVYEENL